MGSSMTTAEETSTEESPTMAVSSKKFLDQLKAAISKLENSKTAASGSDLVCQILPECLKEEDAQVAALTLVEQALVKYGAELKTPRGSKSNPASAKLLEIVFPLMWVDKQPVREVALRVIKMIPTHPRPECWNKLKSDMHTQYCKSLLSMVIGVQKDWPVLWKETVQFFGMDLHSGSNLMNQLLGVIEKAYKNPDVDWTRVQAFKCWQVLIDSFVKASLNPKRIALILIPLKASNHRTEQLTKVKYETFVHLINSVPKTHDVHDCLKAFLHFCFFSTGDSMSPLRSYSRLQPLCIEAVEIAVNRSCEAKCAFRLSKQIALAFAQSLQLQLSVADQGRIKNAWLTLLENISQSKSSDQNRELIRDLLLMFEDVVPLSSGYNRSPPASPNTSSISSMSMNTSQFSSQPQEEFSGILAELMYELLSGPSALSPSQLASVSLYVGKDGMTGTPALMAVQWLLTPGILLSSGCTEKYKTMMNHLINVSLECLGGPLSFIPKVLKLASKALSADRLKLLSSTQTDCSTCTESLTSTWCSMAEVLVRWVNAGGELNQGDAANHDFSCLYTVLQFPVIYLAEHVSSWIKIWGQLYQKSSPQVALASTTGSHEFCDQISSRLSSATKSDPKNLDALLAAAVACGETMVRIVKATNPKWGREHENVVSLLTEVAANATTGKSEKLMTAVARCVAQFENPVPAASCTTLVVENLSPVLLLLLRYPSPNQQLSQQIVSALVAVQAIVEKHWQLPSDLPKEVKTALSSVVDCAKTHPVRNICNAGISLAKSISSTTLLDESSSSDVAPLVRGSILHPPKDIVGSKPTEKKTSTPTSKTLFFSNKSPVESPNRRNKRKLNEAANEEFVVIKRPTPVKMILTEHQKEVLRRKADIPAMYQDLSQDTQNVSQDCVILPSSPANPMKKTRVEHDDEAVMDFSDVGFKNSSKYLDTSVSILEEEKTKKVFGTIEMDDNATMQSVMDTTNEDYLTCSQESVMAERLEEEPLSASPVKEKPAAQTPNRRKSIVPVRKEPTVTRSRIAKSSLVTRSGKLLKQRQSLGNVEFKSPPKVKRQRKSLPASNNDISGRGSSESSEEGKTEPAGGRESIAAPKETKPAEMEVRSSESTLETAKSSDDTLSAASPSTDIADHSSSVSSDGTCSTESGEKLPFSTPPPLIRERPKRKTTPTRKALLLFENKDKVDRVSLAVAGRGSKASRGEQQPSKRPLRSRLKNIFQEGGKKQAESEVTDEKGEAVGAEVLKSSSGSPFNTDGEPIVVIEKLSKSLGRVGEPKKREPELVVISESDSEAQSQNESEVQPECEGTADTEPDVLVSKPDKTVSEPDVMVSESDASVSERDVSLPEPDESVSEPDLTEFEPDVTVSESDVTEREPDVTEPKSDVVVSKPDVTEPKSDVMISKADVTEPKSDVMMSKADVTEPKSDVMMSKPDVTASEPAVTDPKPDLSVSESEKAAALESAVTPASELLQTRADIFLESQDIIESSQTTEKSSLSSITTPRYLVNPKKDETPSSAKFTLRVSDSFTPLHTDQNASPVPATPKAVPLEERNVGKAPRRLAIDDRSEFMPSWMHAKKVISPGKPGRPVHKRISPADLVKVSQGIPSEEAVSTSPPSKSSEGTPTSSPVQTKWAKSESVTPTGSRSQGSFPMRTGRAAHLVGLGQAAAARSGEEIRTTMSPNRKEETVAATAQSSDAEPSVPPPSVALKPANNAALRVVRNGIIASPRVKRRARKGLATRFSDSGQSAVEPQTPGSEWIRKTYQPDATPDSSILKRPRRTPALLDDSSPSSRKKRVSFHDPPVSKSLNFYKTEGDNYSGVVHLSGATDESASGKSPGFEEENKAELSVHRWVKSGDEEKQNDSSVTVIVEETEQEIEREGRLNVDESSVLRQRNYDEKSEHVRQVASKEDKTRRRDDNENQQGAADEENRWTAKARKDDERVGKDDGLRWKKVDEIDEDVNKLKEAEEDRVRMEEEERVHEEGERVREEEERVCREEEEQVRKEEERVRKEEEERVRKEEEERVRKEEEERVRREEEERVRKEAEERVRKEEEERVRKEEEERVRKEAEERVRKEEEERVRKEEEERVRKEEEERVRKEEEERVRREEEERVRREEEERVRREEEERVRREEEERVRREEEERVRREEEERVRREEEERIRKEEEEERVRKEEEEERVRKEEEEERVRKEEEEERVRKEEEEERVRREEEEERTRRRTREEEEERVRKEEEEERVRKEEEEERVRREEEEERVRREEEEERTRRRTREEEEEKISMGKERIRKIEELEEAERVEKTKSMIETRKAEKEKARVTPVSKQTGRLRLKRKGSQETNDIDAVSATKKPTRWSLRRDSEDSSSSSVLDVDEIVVISEHSSESVKEDVKPARARGRNRKRDDDETRRKKEEDRKRKAEELEKADAEWSRKEEIRLSSLPESSPGPSQNAASSGAVTKGPRFDSDLSQIAALSQGDTSTTHPITFPNPGAIYPSLVNCKEPINVIIDSLTGTAWRRNLLRRFSEAKLTTVGHLALLTEEQVNRFAIRPPRKDTLVNALEKYERHFGKTVEQVPSQQFIHTQLMSPRTDPEDDLPLSSLAKSSEVVPLEPQDKVSEGLQQRATVSELPTSTLLKELTDRIGVSGILSQLYESREADLLSAVQTFPGVKKILPNAPFEDLVEECSNRVEGNADVITACNGKLVDFVANAVSKDAVLKSTTSALISKSNGKEILETLFKSVLDHL